MRSCTRHLDPIVRRLRDRANMSSTYFADAGHYLVALDGAALLLLESWRRARCESGVLVSVFVADPTYVEQHKGYRFLETVQQEDIRV